MPLRQQLPTDVSTPGHGQGEGPARYEFRSCGTKEIVGGAGVSEANGVPPAVGCLAARSLGHRTKREAGYQSLDFLVSLLFYII
jgi:hypothetical protein